MSCEVKPFGNIPDLKKVQELFGFSQAEDWLNAVYYSFSPTSEVIAFGHGQKLAFLTTQWPSSSASTTYTISWKGELENPNDIITAVLCLPVYGANVSSGADWTCIAVGLASGLVQFYTDAGVQIFSQKWQQESVQAIKAQSGRGVEEEVHVCYVTCVCVLPGNQLFHILKGLKQNSSKNVKGSNKTNLTQFSDNVTCRKWEYRNKVGTVNDAVVVGPQNTGLFNHLLEHSLEKGFFAKCRSSPPQHSLVLGAGVKPYVGFYFAKEGFVQADLGDVAKAVANKVMSSLPSWIFKSSSQPSQEETQPIPSGESMVCRFGVCDVQRQGINIWLAPGNNLAAVTDNLSRVVLIDCNRGVALRIWKGYRDAQCSFIKVKEKTLKGDKSEKRKSMFLVIYAPRRACLEIWALHHGPKVAAFNVSKNGQLLYNTHGLMGINPGAKAKFSANSCLFLDPSDETLKEILIPFHCALSDANSKTVKDVHLLRRVRLLLRGDSDVEDVISDIETTCSNIQTDEIRYQCLEMLSKNKKVKPIVFKTAILSFKKTMKTDTERIDSSLDGDHPKSMLVLLENYDKLVEFYINLKETKDEDQTAVHDSYYKLCLAASDVETIQTLLDLMELQQNSPTSNKVTFKEKHQEGDFVDFLNVFCVDTKDIILNADKRELFGFIGGNLFRHYLEKSHNIQWFFDCVKNSNISSEDLISLILFCWLEMQLNYTKSEEVIEDMTRLAAIIQVICDLAGEKISYDYNEICPWWQNVREILLESRCSVRGLLAGIVCRNLSLSQQKRESGDDNSSNEDELWEQVSQEAAHWSLLIGKLDDISVLGIILSNPITCFNTKMPTIPYSRPDCSLKSIICGGKGIVAELVAKWLTNSGIHPLKIIEKVKVEPPLEEETQDPVLKHLEDLREHFPFSLESGVLLCQMTWEFMCHWSKNLPSVQYLKAGLSCLDAFRPEDYALKHGLCCMIWNAHLKIPLEATKKVIHKAGRLPKERLCQQDIGISQSLVPEFLEYCLEFFKHFSTSLEHEKRELKFEEILQDGQVPLPYLTLQQNHAINEILNLHTQLCKVLHLIAFFSLKVAKPVTLLFDAMSNQTFFVEINRELPYVLPKADLVLQKHRNEFLCLAVSASMDLIREDLERLYVLEHVAYMEKIEELADLWELDKAAIKRHQIVEMYAHGWDTYAEELLEYLVDTEKIGSLLLEIAGRRLNLYTSTSQKSYLQVASVGSLLLNYLDNIKEKTNGIQITGTAEDIEIEQLVKLSAKAFQCLSSVNSTSLHIAGQMYDACSMLKAMLLLD